MSDLFISVILQVFGQKGNIRLVCCDGKQGKPKCVSALILLTTVPVIIEHFMLMERRERH